MNTLRKWWAKPMVRLFARSVVAGLGAGYIVLKAANDPFSKASLWAAGTVVVWTVIEYFTPLNTLVGLLRGLPKN